MASLPKEPLEALLARAFGEAGPLRDVYLGQVKFSKLMLGICGKLERLKAHHADEIAALKKGFEEEKKELLGLISGPHQQPTGARQVENPADHKNDAFVISPDSAAADGRETNLSPASDWADLETLKGLREQVAELKTELEKRSSVQEENVNSIHVVAVQGARLGCSYCQAVKDTIAAWRSANGLTFSTESVASKYGKMDLRDRDALFAILDLEKGLENEASRTPSGPLTEEELTAEALLARMTDEECDGVKLGPHKVPTLADDLAEADTRSTSDTSSETESDSERLSQPAPLTDAQKQLQQLSEQLDEEAEALNLALKPEQCEGAQQKGDWEREARDAMRHRAEVEARARGNKGKLPVGKPPGDPPRLPSRLGRLPVKTSRFSDIEFDAPKMGRKRSRQDLTLPEERPSHLRAKTDSIPPLTPSPTWKVNGQPEWSGRSPRAPVIASGFSPKGVLGLPSPRVTKSLGGADYIKELDAFCKPKHGKEGPRFEGKLRIWKSGEVMVFCRCPSCTEKHGADGLGMSPVEFEVHAGRGATKKWRHSIWVAIPQPDGHGPPDESTIEKCEELNGGKHFTPVGLTSPNAAGLRALPPPLSHRHPDQLVQCKSCGKWRRFRRVVPSDFARAQKALADPDWKCADHPDPSVASCHIPEERSSRNRKPGCESCYFSELGCSKCRECTGCKYCRPELSSEVVLD